LLSINYGPCPEGREITHTYKKSSFEISALVTVHKTGRQQESAVNRQCMIHKEMSHSENHILTS
jgi:hypothetical protein